MGAALLAIAGAGLQAGIGAAQKVKAAKIARKNGPRPKLKDNPFVQDQYALTGSMAQQGLSDASKQAYLTANDRNLASSIDAILRGGGNANNIADLYENNNDAIRAMAMADDQMRVRNINSFIQYGLQPKAEEDRDQYFLNELVPWKDNAQLAAELSKQGMDNLFKGIDGGLSAGMNMMETSAANKALQTPAPLRDGSFSNVRPQQIQGIVRSNLSGGDTSITEEAYAGVDSDILKLDSDVLRRLLNR